MAECLQAAYDHHAQLESQTESPLPEAIISAKLPRLIFIGAIHYKWIRYPPKRLVGTTPQGGFLNDWSSLDVTEEIPDSDLTELFIGTRVPQGYEDEFRRVLVDRMEHWREVLRVQPDAEIANADEPDTGESAQTGSFKAKRQRIVKKYRRQENLTRDGLAHRTGRSIAAIYGMISGDRTKYSEPTLEDFLAKIGVTSEEWNTP